MAGNGNVRGEMKAHEQTYSGFLSFFKMSTIASFVVAAIVVLLIAN
ncbi:MAG: hypothetical protein JWM38_1769 [Sphingomonas bacterium]|nr:hypothetical protein [Sphingomonas bacterium]MDB5718342.1 hypothetical protein [Sphingomonas bacterium]